jgi:hypothetical protein
LRLCRRLGLHQTLNTRDRWKFASQLLYRYEHAVSLTRDEQQSVHVNDEKSGNGNGESATTRGEQQYVLADAYLFMAVQLFWDCFIELGMFNI